MPHPAKKPTRGGPRAGSGRPRNGPEARVLLSCRVAPETLAALRAMGPLGQTLDRLLAPK